MRGAGERVARAAARYVKQAARAVGRIGRGTLLTVVGPRLDRPRVFYGFTRMPRMSTGGIVKVQRMQSRFPNAPWRFNVLYLVSSRLPADASALARLGPAHGVPLVLNQNGVAYPAWHGPGWEATNAPMARVLRVASHVFYQSEFCKVSADRFLGVPKGTWEVLHNAVDTDVFTPQASRIAGPLTLLVAGTQDLRYRVSVALEVLALVLRSRPDVRMVIAGRLRWAGNARQATMDAHGMAAALGVADRVVFAGLYTQAGAPMLYRRGDLLLHAKYNDPSPGVVIEAMACGLPVVFSASGGVPELVGSEAGIGVPAELSWERDIPPDPAAMAAAVLRVTERLSDFSAAARQRAVERFDMRQWLARHADVFSDIVRNKRVALMAQGPR